MPRTLVLAIVAAVAAAPLPAQGVRGTLTEGGGRTPVAGALVVLVDTLGRIRTEVLTGADGRFLLRAPGPGRYTLRADRIGYQSTRSEPFAVGAQETVEVRLTAPSRSVMLAALTVTATARCTRRPAEGAATAVLWEEARKALRSSAGTLRQYPYRYRVRRTFRELDARGIVRAEATREQDGFSENPFVAVPAGELAEHGYVEVRGDTVLFSAPDAQVLLSDTFEDAHCFRIRAADAGEEGLIGLAFEPVARAAGGPRTPGISGVLWLDRATAELRRLEYSYVNLPPRVVEGLAGGTVEFQRLPNGAWIVPAWRIRMPAALMHRAALSTLAGPGGLQVRQVSPTAVAEEMGEVLEVRTRQGESIPVAGALFARRPAEPDAAGEAEATAEPAGAPEAVAAGTPEQEAAPEEDGSRPEPRPADRPIALDAVTVTARRVGDDDYAHTRSRRSGVVTREQIDARTGVARSVADLVAGIPGVRVSRSSRTGGGDATAEVCIEPTHEASRPGCAAVGVVLNDVAQPFSLAVLRDLPAADIESVEYIRSLDAEGLYGQLGRNGVLRIYTVGYRPSGR